MAGRRMIYGGDGAANTNTLLVSSSYEPSDSLFLSGSSPSFLGSRSMVSFEDVNAGKRLDRPFFRSFDQEENVDEEFDEYFHQPEKKRRLTADQVQFLEKSFEIENKLEPERKVQLAKDLGLQPRQVAIWFQNRRARWKTKQLEKDYEVLQSRYNSLKSDYDGLLKEKEQLNAEVVQLTDKLLHKQNGNANSDSSDSNQQSQSPPRDLIVDSVSEGEVSRKPILNCKLEDPSSTKSDVLDSDSPPYIDGGNSSLIEAGDTSYVFEPDQSDLSQDEDDNLSKKILGPSCSVFPKIEDNDYPDPDPLANSGYFVFANEDQEFSFGLSNLVSSSMFM